MPTREAGIAEYQQHRAPLYWTRTPWASSLTAPTVFWEGTTYSGHKEEMRCSIKRSTKGQILDPLEENEMMKCHQLHQWAPITHTCMLTLNKSLLLVPTRQCDEFHTTTNIPKFFKSLRLREFFRGYNIGSNFVSNSALLQETVITPTNPSASRTHNPWPAHPLLHELRLPSEVNPCSFHLKLENLL